MAKELLNMLVLFYGITSLPTTIGDSPSLNIFKRDCKIFIFHCIWNNYWLVVRGRILTAASLPVECLVG